MAMRRVPVSITDTESEFALATKSRWRSSSQAMAVGCSPTLMVSVTPGLEVNAHNRARGRDAALVDDHAIGARRQAGRQCGSPSAGHRPPQLLTQATRPLRSSTAPNGATPLVLTLSEDAAGIGVENGQRVVEYKRHHRAPARAGARDRRRPAQVPPQVRCERHERRPIQVEQPERATLAVSRLACGHRQPDKRRLALCVEDETLECRRAGQLPAIAYCVLRPVEAIDMRAAGLASAPSAPRARRQSRRT